MRVENWQNFIDNQVLIMNDIKLPIITINKVTQFSLCPPEIMLLINKLELYYQWFYIPQSSVRTWLSKWPSRTFVNRPATSSKSEKKGTKWYSSLCSNKCERRWHWYGMHARSALNNNNNFSTNYSHSWTLCWNKQNSRVSNSYYEKSHAWRWFQPLTYISIFLCCTNSFNTCLTAYYTFHGIIYNWARHPSPPYIQIFLKIL